MRMGLEPGLKRRLLRRAYQRALRDLRDHHRSEFDALYERHAGDLGVYYDGVDLDVALPAAERRLKPGRRSLSDKTDIVSLLTRRSE